MRAAPLLMYLPRTAARPRGQNAPKLRRMEKDLTSGARSL